MKTYLVIPTIRSLNFLKEWDKKNELESTHIIVVIDKEENKIDIPKIHCRSIQTYSHYEIEKEFKKNHWIFPWKTASIRSYGFYKAYKEGADYIITIDDDCLPYSKHFVEKHLQNLNTKLPINWTPTYPFRNDMYTRGFPYFVRERTDVVLSHGIWAGVPDWDGITQIRKNSIRYEKLPEILSVIPSGMFFPMSSMNVAFKREVIPLMYQLLMGTKKDTTPWGYDRFDDIWSGIFAKKILDHHHLGVVSGSPAVYHERESNVLVNIKKEASGIGQNETLWKFINDLEIEGNTLLDSYKFLAKSLEKIDDGYFSELSKAMLIWAELFD